MTNAGGSSAWQPTTSGNILVRDGDVVVKHYGAHLAAYVREGELLARFGALADPLPVPQLARSRAFGELRYWYIEGLTGNEALTAGLAPQVLAGMGAFLRRLHALDPDPLADLLAGAGPVVSHGDFAPYNVLIDAATGALRAVLDWEEARRGEPALDLAWCEAQVISRFPHLRGALRHLYDAYGASPDRATREQVLEHRMEQLRARANATSGESAPPDADVLYRCSFQDAEEAAAFVAALSRALASPAGARHQELRAEALVWASEGGREIFLSPGALRATAARFGTPDAQPVRLRSVPVTCRPLFGAGAIPAWGIDGARRRLTTR